MNRIVSIVFSLLIFCINVSAQGLSALNFDFGNGVRNEDWVQAIRLLQPDCRSTVSGEVEVKFVARGMQYAKAMCWSVGDKQDSLRWGCDKNLTPKGIKLKKDGRGSFRFNAELLPHGPMTVRIYAVSKEGKKDVFELQLYNKGGISWHEGIPSEAPPAAQGLKLVFSDDFDGELSISDDGRRARYNAHKPLSGDFSGWPFTDVSSVDNPFSRVDTYLKIAARKREGTKGSTGLIASVNMDGEGFWFKAPCYLECRFVAQSAPGTWPAFWTVNQIRPAPGDELDIIEAYGGLGEGNPNFWGYNSTTHYWEQRDEEGHPRKALSKSVDMLSVGGRSSWSTTFHTYGLYIGFKETVYYLDNIEVFRHPTNSISRDFPHLFMVNYAIGGISGWKIDLERYGNGSDMYVDYIRVYGD